MSVDSVRIRAAVRELLEAIGEDPTRDGLRRTPERVADSYAEFFGGLSTDPIALLAETVPVKSADVSTPRTSDAVLLRGIAFRSMCEHHLLPFLGTAHIAYVPRERVVGLGRIPAVVDALASRPQIQERLAEEIADAIERGLDARGVLVVLDAAQQCVATRGSRQSASSTVTIVARGDLGEPAARAELMALIGAAPGSRSSADVSVGPVRPVGPVGSADA